MDCCQTWPDISSVTIKDVQDKAEKNFFKVCLVGTLDLCLLVPKKIHKTRYESNHSRPRKLPKTVEKIEICRLLPVFGRFCDL